MNSLRRETITAAALLLLVQWPATAQTNNEVNAGIEFDFSLPGARSLALGGAFVAVADDATAAWANPAGLMILTKKEVSAEGRLWRFNNEVTARGMGFGQPTGIGVDTIAGLQNASSTDRTASPAFLSFVLPSARWSLGVYRHQLSNYQSNVISEGPFLRVADYSRDPAGEVDRVEPFSGDMELKIADYGIGVAVRASDHLSLGGSVGVHEFSLRSTNTRASYVPVFAPDPSVRGSLVGAGQRFGPADFSPQNVSIVVTQTGDDRAVAANVGALWRAQKWSVGGAFRQGPEFTFTSVATRGPAAPPVGQPLTPLKDVPFHVPNVYALGAAVRPTDRWMVAVEYDRVQYSQLSDKGVEVLGISEVNAAFGAKIVSDLRFPDANQLRVGTEYAFVKATRTILLRAGTWYDPNHRLEYVGDQPRLQALFRPGTNEYHFAPGFGIAASRAQFDFAVDVSKRVNTLSFSTVVRF